MDFAVVLRFLRFLVVEIFFDFPTIFVTNSYLILLGILVIGFARSSTRISEKGKKSPLDIHKAPFRSNACNYQLIFVLFMEYQSVPKEHFMIIKFSKVR